MKNIVITGAGKGLGLAVVKQLLKDAGNNVIAISRNTQSLRVLKATVPQLNIVELDITNIEQKDIIEIVAHCKGELQIDGLLNNAAQIIAQPFQDFTLEQIKHLYNVNVFAQLNLIQLLLPYMGKHGTSHIVNIGSMGGYQGSVKFPTLSIYASTKAAMANLTEGLAVELTDRNIIVNCLALGAVKTEMLKEAFPDYDGGIDVTTMSAYVSDFIINGYKVYNGKTLPVSNSTP